MKCSFLFKLFFLAISIGVFHQSVTASETSDTDSTSEDSSEGSEVDPLSVISRETLRALYAEIFTEYEIAKGVTGDCKPDLVRKIIYLNDLKPETESRIARRLQIPTTTVHKIIEINQDASLDTCTLRDCLGLNEEDEKEDGSSDTDSNSFDFDCYEYEKEASEKEEEEEEEVEEKEEDSSSDVDPENCEKGRRLCAMNTHREKTVSRRDEVVAIYDSLTDEQQERPVAM